MPTISSLVGTPLASSMDFIALKASKVAGNSQQIKTQDETFAPDEFTKRLGDAYDPTLRVCVDTTRRIITSQAPGTAIEFALEVVRMLAGDHVANTIDRYLMVAR